MIVAHIMLHGAMLSISIPIRKTLECGKRLELRDKDLYM